MTKSGPGPVELSQDSGNTGGQIPALSPWINLQPVINTEAEESWKEQRKIPTHYVWVSTLFKPLYDPDHDQITEKRNEAMRVAERTT